MSGDELFRWSFSIASVVAILGMAATCWQGHWVATAINAVMVALVIFQVVFMRYWMAIANKRDEIVNERKWLALRFEPIAKAIDAAVARVYAPRVAREEYERAIAASAREGAAGGPGLAPTMKRDRP